jgi:hypothetical protein
MPTSVDSEQYGTSLISRTPVNDIFRIHVRNEDNQLGRKQGLDESDAAAEDVNRLCYYRTLRRNINGMSLRRIRRQHSETRAPLSAPTWSGDTTLGDCLSRANNFSDIRAWTLRNRTQRTWGSASFRPGRVCINRPPRNWISRSIGRGAALVKRMKFAIAKLFLLFCALQLFRSAM